jgi:hypothetical protein
MITQENNTSNYLQNLDLKEFLNQDWSKSIQRCERRKSVVDPLKYLLENINFDTDFPNSSKAPFHLYLLERVLRRQRYLIDDFETRKNKTVLKSSQQSKLLNQVSKLYDQDFNQIINNCLIDEYSYLLDSLQDKKYSFIELNLSVIAPGSKKHYDNLDSGLVKIVTDNIKQLRKIPLAQAIIIPRNNNSYRIIDGYHRLKAFKSINEQQIHVFLAEEK